jgi:hypothetical protein
MLVLVLVLVLGAKMDKASGVYYYTIDNSVRPAGSSQFGGVVPMFTVKGAIGKLLTVTAKNFKDIVGYDLDYNPNYLGLEMMLQSVARLEVLRLNQRPYVGNYIWTSSSGVVSGASEDGIGATAEIPEIDFGANTDIEAWAAHKTPGHWGDFGVWFTDDEVGGSHVYTVYYGAKIDATRYKTLESKVFSFNKNDVNYWGKVILSNFAFGFKEGAASLPAGVAGVKVLLDGGDNGDPIESLTVDGLLPRLAALDESGANVVVGNGFSANQGLCSALVEAGEKRIMSVFIDVPDLTSPNENDLSNDMVFNENDGVLKALHCAEWTSGLYRSEYCQPVAVPDVASVSVGDVFVWPSVNLFKIYASMFQDYGHVRYPPAGNSYGSVSISRLLKSDFHLYKDELKTARVNYQMVGSRGPVMWEQRTTYGLDSDLSYASTVFILRDLRLRLISFMENYNFKFMTPMELLSIRSGLDSILGSFKQGLFLVGYTLTVPSFAEAQEAGRDLDIYISVSVMNDAEVINLRVTLENAATLGA